MLAIIRHIQKAYGTQVTMSMRHRCLGIHSLGAEEKVVTSNNMILGRVIWQGGRWYAYTSEFPEVKAKHYDPIEEKRIGKGSLDSITEIFKLWGHAAC